MKSKKPAAEKTTRERKSAIPGKKIQPARTSDPRIPLVICIVLALASILIYAQTFHFGFVAYDDDQYVYENPVVQAGLTLSNAVWAFTAFHYANWHPLTWLSYLLDAQIFGVDAGPFHVTNVILHAAS